jgi:hypothetical protein
MPPIDNLLPRLIRSGQLTEDFGAFSDDELRLGLMMLIDNLERYEETLDLVTFTSQRWRQGRDPARDARDWDRALEDWKDGVPAEYDATAPWQFYQANNEGQSVRIGELDRGGLERELRDSWTHLQRAREGAKRLSRVMEQIQAGHWFTAMSETREVEPVPAQTAKPRSP